MEKPNYSIEFNSRIINPYFEDLIRIFSLELDRKEYFSILSIHFAHQINTNQLISFLEQGGLWSDYRENCNTTTIESRGYMEFNLKIHIPCKKVENVCNYILTFLINLFNKFGKEKQYSLDVEKFIDVKVVAEGPLITYIIQSNLKGYSKSINKIEVYDLNDLKLLETFNHYKVYEFDQWAPVTSCFTITYFGKFLELSRVIESIESFEKEEKITEWINDKLKWDEDKRILTIL